MKIVEFNVQTGETTIIETPDVEPTLQISEVEVLKAQTIDLNLQIIDLYETLIGAGVL